MSSSSDGSIHKNSPEQVGQYYDRTTVSYLKATGDIIQAFRPKDDAKLLNYIFESAGISAGMRILDAGCGVGAPAIWFAKKAEVIIDAITISKVQVNEAVKKISNVGLGDRINVSHGDYHLLDELFSENLFDLVLFIESLGHSSDVKKAAKGAYYVLKPGGAIYIKDFFIRKETNDLDLAKEYELLIEKINRNYSYNTLDLIEVISALRSSGFLIEYIRKPRFEACYEFTVKFELEAGIDTWKDMAVLKPAEWFEIKCIKPEATDK